MMWKHPWGGCHFVLEYDQFSLATLAIAFFFLHPIWFSDIIHAGCSGSSGRIHSAVHNLYHIYKKLFEAV